MNAERLLTADELAEALAISKRTVMTWLAEGRIPAAVREAQTLRFDLAKVKAALARRAAKQTAARRTVATIPDGMMPTY